MKKNVLVVLLSICLIMLSVVCVLGNESSLNPIIKILSYSGPYVGEKYYLRFSIENIEKINDCTIVLHYNDRVLKAGEYIIEWSGDYNHIASIKSENTGKIELLLEEISDSKQKGFANIEFYFDIKEEGDTEFEVEIIKDDCKNDANVQVDISNLITETIIDPSELDIVYKDGVINISGHGRVTKALKEYDINSTIPEDTSLIKSIVVEEGITEIHNNRIWSDYESLKDIWYPNTLNHTEFPSGLKRDEDVIIHANGMTYAEEYATKYNRSFKLNEGFTIGDLDSNGIFDADDALKILKMAAKLDTLYKWSADIDGSGTVDAIDALTVLKRAAKLL